MGYSEEFDQLVTFFRSDIPNKLLQRYSYTPEQTEKITRAIREAKSSQPNILLMRRADEIMNEVAKTQHIDYRRELSQEEQKLLKMPSLYKNSPLDGELTESTKQRWIARFILIGVVVLLITFVMKSGLLH